MSYSWGRASGKLVIEVVLDIDGALTDSSGTTAFDFDFKLINPSLHQDAPGVGLELSYVHRDSSRNAWTNNATNNGARKVAGGGGGVGLDLTSATYPMKIRTAAVTSSIRQSSPFPCDDTNTITVDFFVSIDLYPRCLPQILLSGLTGSRTVSNESLPITFSASSQQASTTGIWDLGSGTLTAYVLVSENITANTPQNFFIVLENPKDSQSSPLTDLTLTLKDTTDLHNVAEHASSTMTFAADESGVDTTGKDACQTQAGDAKPLQIRTVTFTHFEIAQSTFFPCANNSLTVLIRTDGPLLAVCANHITVAGLLGSATPDNGSLDLSTTPSGIFGATGRWVQDSGVLTVPVAANAVVMGCTDVTFVFDLLNPVTAQAASLITLSEHNVVDGNLSAASFNNGSDPIFVVNVSWSEIAVEDNSSFPCESSLCIPSLSLSFSPAFSAWSHSLSCFPHSLISCLSFSLSFSVCHSCSSDSSSFPLCFPFCSSLRVLSGVVRTFGSV